MALNSSQIHARKLSGNYIYQEKKKTVFYDVFTKNGYVITDSQAKTYSLFSIRFSACALLACILVYATHEQYLLSIGISLAAMIVLEIIFRVFFIYRLTKIEHFIPTTRKKGYIEETAENETTFKIILLILAAFAFWLMLVGYSQKPGLSPAILILCYICMTAAFIIGAFNIIALVRKAKRR